MNWLQDLLTNPNSIAHIVALYAFVIAAGVLLGKIKFFGISLGVTFVLFVGILAGHFGFTGNPAILSFVQDFGLILFVFCLSSVSDFRSVLHSFLLLNGEVLH